MGTILRTVLIAALIFVLVRVLQHFLGRYLTSYTSKEGNGEEPTLLKCAKCGTWTPKEAVVRRGEQVFCSNDCADEQT
ncbi:MAG: hypothetical protein HQL69_05850 [Magnetococcales bacterium]|nr:hypothetical protein [Magnetococcales bacterium]